MPLTVSQLSPRRGVQKTCIGSGRTLLPHVCVELNVLHAVPAARLLWAGRLSGSHLRDHSCDQVLLRNEFYGQRYHESGYFSCPCLS
jgi:hypothetical protein